MRAEISYYFIHFYKIQKEKKENVLKKLKENGLDKKITLLLIRFFHYISFDLGSFLVCLLSGLAFFSDFFWRIFS